MSFIDYYDLLGVAENSSSEEIKKAFRKLVMLYHPDTAKDEESNAKFLLLQTAYNTLMNEDKRKNYNEALRLHIHSHQLKNANKSGPRKKPTYHENMESASKESVRSWQTLQNYNSFGGKIKEKTPTSEIEPIEDDGKVVNKVKKIIRKTFNKENPEVKAAQRIFSEHSSRETKRAFFFTISALESLQESSREVMLEEGNKQRKVRIKIPARIQDGTILKVRIPGNDDFPTYIAEVQIRISNDGFLERNFDDITLNIPISPFEALSGAEIEVPSLKGKMKLKVPTPWKLQNTIKISGEGLFNESLNKSGDLYIKTYIVLPDYCNETTLQAAKLLDESFNGDIRRLLPDCLIKEIKNESN